MPMIKYVKTEIGTRKIEFGGMPFSRVDASSS